MGVVEDELLKYQAENADGEEAPPEAAAPAEVPKEKIRVSSLDDIILDDPSLPDSLRGQAGSALFRDRTDAIHKLNDAGFQKNKAETERDMALALLEKHLVELKARQNEAPPPPPPTSADRLRERGVDSTNLWAEGALPRVVEAGADAAEDRFRPRFETVEQKIARLEQTNADRAEADRNARIVGAFQAARPQEISPEDWNEFAPIASTYAIHGNKPTDNAQTYREAFDWHQKISGKFGSKPTPVPTPAPAAPAPPVGGGKPAAPPSSKPSAHLNNKEREATAKIVAIYAKLGMTATADDILNDVRKDPKTRGMFP